MMLFVINGQNEILMVGVYNEMCYNIIDEIVVGFFGS